MFLDSVSFLPCPLRKLPEAFGLTACKSWYTHYFNTDENLDYVGPIPDVSYYGVSEMGEEDRRDFLAWYESQKEPIFDNRRVLESYCQDDVTVLRQVCEVFRREFMQIGNLEVFLESIIIAFACNKFLHKRFLQPDTIGLIPTGGYTCNHKYIEKALIWLLHVEQIDGEKIMHGLNGREYKVPALPHFGVDGYCPETRTINEFFECHFHSYKCQPFRDVSTLSGDTLAERYERTMSRLEQITRAGYLVKVQWEFEFDDAGRLAQPIVQQSPLWNRNALYGGRTEAMRLHYKARENETIQNVDPYISKYFKFPVGHQIIHVGDACKDIEACLRMDGLIKCSIVPPERFMTPSPLLDVIINSCFAL